MNEQFPQAHKPKGSKTISIVALVLSAIAVLGCLFTFLLFLLLVDDFEELRAERPIFYIDLTHTAVQPIGEGFNIRVEGVEEHLTGIKIKGQIINGTSLDYKKVKIKISVGKAEQEFYINTISSRHGAKFDVYIPDVPVERSELATVEMVDWLVSFIPD